MTEHPTNVAVTIHPHTRTEHAYQSRVFESGGTLMGSVSLDDTTNIIGNPEAMYALGAALQTIARKIEVQRREEMDA